MRLLSITNKYAGAIEVYDNAVDVTGIVEYLDRHCTWTEARIGVDGPGEVDMGRRDNKVTFINPYHFTCPDLLRSMATTVWHYLNDYAERYDIVFRDMEHININRYGPGERYVAHADDGPGKERIVSALAYLNDVEEGGETEFIYQDVSISPRAGRLVIFPSNYAYAHAAHPPSKGVKYSAAFWTVQ